MSEFKFPSQPLDLPSRGLVYPENNPLSSGVIELYIPTARHEDILTNQTFIKQGIVIDKFIQAIIASPINYDDLILGDKNAIMLAARILAYGKDYTFTYEGEKVTVDLTVLEPKQLNLDLFIKGINEFDFELPKSKHKITFKILSHKDEKNIEGEIKGLKNVSKTISADVTTTYKHMIVAVNGNRDQKFIRDFVDVMPMQDARALRKYVADISPDYDMSFSFTRNDGEIVEGLRIPITVEFFWPE